MRTLTAEERTRLKPVCHIDSRENETVFGVLGRMETLLEFFKKNPEFESLVPFLEAYYRITKGVVDQEVENGCFEDFSSLQQLDIRFAELYLQPMWTFLTTGTAETPWKTYFSYCSRSDSIPLAEMSIGINTHINADLLRAIAELEYAEETDYQRVNPILRNQLFKLLEFLFLREHDRVSLEVLFLKPITQREFRKNIIRWRNEVWEYAHSLSTNSIEGEWPRICRRTEELSQTVIDIVHNFAIHRLPSLINQCRSMSIRPDTAQ